MSERITENPISFAKNWYDLDSIHNSIRRGNSIPRDTESLDFAKWLSENYVLAMTRGATLAMSEMQSQNDELIDALRELHDFACQSYGKHEERSVAAFKRAGELLRKLDEEKDES